MALIGAGDDQADRLCARLRESNVISGVEPVFARLECQRSGTASLGWIIQGRGIIAIGAQTTRSTVVPVDPRAPRSREAWHRTEAWDRCTVCPNGVMPRFGMMLSCGSIRRNKERDQKAQRHNRTHCVFSTRRTRKESASARKTVGSLNFITFESRRTGSFKSFQVLHGRQMRPDSAGEGRRGDRAPAERRKGWIARGDLPLKFIHQAQPSLNVSKPPLVIGR